ncbi:OsmC family protein [Bacillus sp. DTU_2020_1000418_1_SI_GHA_SEK_038]|uniref:OsmC family protein n=1 Tax=Bacillus sp. DTU_2020_1000418_1_SI_GHA_SEK_038 TaxID=3077585 RepID=UPI0028E6923E|nr:OsmC family protein [Bacillus sp. DTU_2020_1000418_1_SI_GHA_SEK_038]WNS77666.1 OsmC family protein [Bacillus sp. DTU_2020_1000418_1_SI_GHA_SEK_038]
MAISTFKAKTVLKENVLVETESRGHKVIVDEPATLGGTDKGMNPVELLLSALGACQSIVARTYAKQFNIDLKKFWVELEGDIDLDGFFNKSDVRPGFLSILYTFHIETDAPEDKVEAFKAFVEDHCPVGDTIANPVNLVSSKMVVHQPVK